jgi:hypothetical protein
MMRALIDIFMLNDTSFTRFDEEWNENTSLTLICRLSPAINPEFVRQNSGLFFYERGPLTRQEEREVPQKKPWKLISGMGYNSTWRTNMKRIALVILLVGVVLSLTQCELFQTTLEYNINGNSTNLNIRYNDGTSGEIVDATGVQTQWSSGTFVLYSDERPFLAYIEVTNDDIASTGVTVEILEDGSVVASTNLAALATGNLHYILE